MRSPLASWIAASSALAALVWVSPANAEVSSWVHVGGGAFSWTQGGADRALNGALNADIGVGSSPDGRLIFGGLARMTTMLEQGTEFAVLARGASWGFQAGGFGLALDAGAYVRFWGVGSTGFAGAVNLGAPLGFTLSIQGSVGTNDANAIGVIAGLDLLRLTLYRQSFTNWWPNPNPGQQETRRDAWVAGRRYW
ncbi:hypothetical protein [Chondromyces crocatus]|uniref:hypothetical protein n=1 Tax=Chondromyces crocatus TaxID=52 RepID=UPI00067DE327|nr:hypothetical protein [Chondromyces crocatus]